MGYVSGAIIFLVGLLGGAALGVAIRQYWVERKSRELHEQTNNLLADARKEAETIKKEAILQAKDTLFQMKADFERESKESRKEFQNLEKRLLQKEENLDKKSEGLDKREATIAKREKLILQQEREVGDKEKELKAIIDEQRGRLESLSGISSQQAKDMLIQMVENEARHEAALMVKKIETEARETSDKKAKNIIALAIQR